MSSFYYGNAFGQIAGGWLSARFGGHLIMATSVCLPAIMTLLMPLTVMLGAGGVIAARVLTGLLMVTQFALKKIIFLYRKIIIIIIKDLLKNRLFQEGIS